MDKSKSTNLFHIDDVIARLQELREKHGNTLLNVKLSGCETLMAIRDISHVKVRKQVSNGSMSYLQSEVIITPELDMDGISSRDKGVTNITKSMNDAKAMCWRMIKSFAECAKCFVSAYKKGEAVDKVIATMKKMQPVLIETRDSLKAIEDFDYVMKRCIGGTFPSASYAAIDEFPIDPSLTDEEFAKTLTSFFKGVDSLSRLGGYVELVKKLRKEKSLRESKMKMLDDRIKKEAKGSAEALNAKILRGRMEKIADVLTTRENLVKEKFRAHRHSIAAEIDEISERIFSSTELEEDFARRYR